MELKNHFVHPLFIETGRDEMSSQRSHAQLVVGPGSVTPHLKVSPTFPHMPDMVKTICSGQRPQIAGRPSLGDLELF